jgi:hypothetical protein
MVMEDAMSETASTKIILKNERLKVEITNPGDFYKGSRFDWNGFIMQVTLDDTHTFCVPEALEPNKGSGGRGFCGEFGIEEALGYDETGLDDYFPKIGVGLLKKTDIQPYNFFRPYQYLRQLSNITVDKETTSFSTDMADYNGYAYDYTKTVSICKNHLRIKYLLHNKGSKKISTTEYCHNFIGIDNKSIDSSYSLELPCEIRMENVHGEFYTKNNLITWPDTEMNEEFYCMVQGYDSNGSNSWEIYNHKVGVGVREIDDFPVYKFALWGYRHVISPETFMKIELEQGQSVNWTREYEFFY